MEIVSQMNTMLTDLLGPMGPQIALGGLGLLLIVITLPSMLVRKADPLDKLRDAARARTATMTDSQQLRVGNHRVDKLEKFAHFLEPKDAEQLSNSRLRMMRAGYRSKNAVRTFHAAQFALGLGFLLLGVIYTLLTQGEGEPDTTSLLMTSLLPGVVGYYLPIYWVQRRLQTRKEEMVNGFPDALDMMLVCVEAGQSLDQSIIRVSREIKIGYPALGEEFEMVAHEVKAGKERAQVLRDFAERCGIPDIASFVTTMIQSATFGTSIAEALRVYGAEMRDKRVLRAEEKANVLPTKLTLGTMMFTVPPLMIILIGPSLYGIAKHMGGGMGN
ncbi:MAG: type II secretion system F family protein [Gemmobacter sp.]|nr:type II secretion system F family protein [Gemmobacter sp.]